MYSYCKLILVKKTKKVLLSKIHYHQEKENLNNLAVEEQIKLKKENMCYLDLNLFDLTNLI